MADLASRYAALLADIESLMLAELGHWPMAHLPELASIVESQIRHSGKRLRPMLALIVADGAGGELADVVAPAAAVEFYHVASLVLDDVQDNTRVRRGRPAVHVTAGIGTAINVAATVRSLSYHPIHRSGRHEPERKWRLHRELDSAATRLVLGQAVDIGWHAGWYKTFDDFPYEQMLRDKTGALFGCAAAMGAVSAGADDPAVASARAFGQEVGVLYHLVDDFADTFGRSSSPGRPRLDDLRAGKMSGPARQLLTALRASGRDPEARRVAAGLANDHGPPPEDVAWLLDLMAELAVEATLRRDIEARADHLRGSDLGTGLRGPGFDALLDSILARMA
jgi:geranylgeranyl pyrophosphate synthase